MSSRKSNRKSNSAIAYPGFLTTPLKARACAGEQGSRGAGEQGSRGENKNTKFFPLCPSAPLPLCSIKRLKLVRNAGYLIGWAKLPYLTIYSEIMCICPPYSTTTSTNQLITVSAIA
ncbi:hypothetical protein [Nostoc sp.]|uniref:hypothetical protein n=1 Tax=Nostoc sp. TaxID=1180 RepID=UPI002FEF66CA